MNFLYPEKTESGEKEEVQCREWDSQLNPTNLPFILAKGGPTAAAPFRMALPFLFLTFSEYRPHFFHFANPKILSFFRLRILDSLSIDGKNISSQDKLIM